MPLPAFAALTPRDCGFPEADLAMPTLGLRLTLLAAAVGLALFALLALVATGPARDNRTPPFEPRRAELPGGFDPVPRSGM